MAVGIPLLAGPLRGYAEGAGRDDALRRQTAQAYRRALTSHEGRVVPAALVVHVAKGLPRP